VGVLVFCVAVAVGTGVSVAVGRGVAVEVAVGSGVGVKLGVKVGVKVAVIVGVKVAVGVGVGWAKMEPQAVRPAAPDKKKSRIDTRKGFMNLLSRCLSLLA
jgi:hypothetical protein